MSKNSFQFPLIERIDGNGEAFLIGSSDLPVMVDLREVTFLVFYPLEGTNKGTLLIRPRNPSTHRDFRRNEDLPDQN